MGTGVPPSYRIVTQIAAAEGVHLTELEPPLHAVVDPEALDELVESTANRSTDVDLTIEFTYHGYAVRVGSSGDVDVEPNDRTTDSNSPVGDVRGDYR